jgi:hypothetical protein
MRFRNEVLKAEVLIYKVLKNDLKKKMNTLKSIISGAVGASVLTAAHETLRTMRPHDAPRMDILGERAIQKGIALAGEVPPPAESLYAPTLAGDLVSNTLYYSMVGSGEDDDVWFRGVMLGAAAGLGAVMLPGPMGLGEAPSKRTPQTAVMTVGLYLLGGLAAAAAANFFFTEDSAR